MVNRRKFFLALSILLVSSLAMARLLPDIPICLNNPKRPGKYHHTYIPPFLAHLETFLPAGFDVHNTVRLGFNNWETSKISTAIARILLAEVVGIPNVGMPIDQSNVWDGVASGVVHASLEYW